MKHCQRSNPHHITPSATCVRSTEPYLSAANAEFNYLVSFSRMTGTEQDQPAVDSWLVGFFLFPRAVRRGERVSIYVCMYVSVCVWREMMSSVGLGECYVGGLDVGGDSALITFLSACSPRYLGVLAYLFGGVLYGIYRLFVCFLSLCFMKWICIVLV